MDYQNYDDYMRNVLGFSNMNCPNMYMNSQMPFQSMNSNMNMNQFCDSLERMYPDTYRVIYPMVVSACNGVTMPVTEDMLDAMTDDIYDRAEMDDRINVDINITIDNRQDSNADESRQEMGMRRPRRRNRFLRDLIRILLLRELIGRRPRFPRRPF
ncbi:MAG: hypothetical protein ACI4VQ_03140 [Clostridia bacterium]